MLDIADNVVLIYGLATSFKEMFFAPLVLDCDMQNSLQNDDFGGGQVVLCTYNTIWTNKPNACIKGAQIQSHVVLCKI